MSNCEKAVQINPLNSEAWHYVASTNDEAAIFYSKKINAEFGSQLQKKYGMPNDGQTQIFLHKDFGHKNLPLLISSRAFDGTPERAMAKKYLGHIESAFRGLIQLLSLSSQTKMASTTKTLQRTLRLLKIWLQHGNIEGIIHQLKDGFEKIDLKVWIDVIPQLLARIDIDDTKIKETLIDLIERISVRFPQALIYSLSVTLKSTASGRREAAEQLIQKLKATQPVLIDQAFTISNELNRSAILLSEVWQEAIEEASRIYFHRNDGKAMYHYIKPYHDEMEKLPETMNEIAFYQGYASDLLEAFSWMKRYMQSDNPADINQAWDTYYNIFRRI